MSSIARPSRLVRESATTMRYCGLRILPIRRSRIFTATVCSLLLRFSAAREGGSRVSADGTVGFAPETTRWTGDTPGLEGAERVPDTSDPFCQIQHGYLTSD